MTGIKDSKNAKTTSSSSGENGVRLKICGMKYPENITDIAALQPDYFGFIFYKKSSRFFDGHIPELPTSIKKVGVFVNATLEEILAKVERYHLDIVQLHGQESPEFCEALQIRLADSNIQKQPNPVNIVKVFSIKDHFNFEKLTPYEAVCDFYLFDTKGELPGGNGYVFNWELLKDYPSTKPYFLSGGIGLETMDDLAEFLQERSKNPQGHYCHAIDVNSRFENAPGLKNITLLEKFKNRINKSTHFR